MPKLPPKDPFVLLHISGTIHRLRRDKRTLCGLEKKKNYTRTKLSKAKKYKGAHFCSKCGPPQS